MWQNVGQGSTLEMYMFREKVLIKKIMTNCFFGGGFVEMEKRQE